MNAILPRFLALLLVLVPSLALGKIEAPDHVIYGNATLFGALAPPGTVIEARTPAGVVIASYRIGREPRLGNRFALRIPMDAVEPRLPGRARPGDPLQLFVGTRIAAETSAGAIGVAVRLDLDPQNMGTGPAVSIDDVEVLEGDSGLSAAVFAVHLNDTSNEPVILHWHTEDGTATGAAGCDAAGADYLAESEMSTSIPAGSLSASITVQVCGDTRVEPNETFRVRLTGIDGGVLMENFATATIIDDDDVPGLTVFDSRVLEPSSGSIDMVFRARLSRSATNAVAVNFATANLTATAGQDYQAASGVLQIPAGETEGEIRVPVLADATVEPDEQLRLLLSNPVAVRLERSEARGTIVDPAHDPALTPVTELVGGPDGLPALVGPSGITLAPDGRHAYVPSETQDALLAFARAEDGTLALVASYTSASSGLESALLDGARAAVVSADGRHVYLAARGSGAVVGFERDTATGTLSFLLNQQSDALQGAKALALSPDGRHLYVAGGTADTLVVFARDEASGALTLLEAERNNQNDASDAGGTVLALDRPSGVAVSPDGRQVYVAARFGNAVLVFDRSHESAAADFGRLSFAASLRNGLGGVQGLAGAYGLAIDASGRHVYVVGEASNSVVLFDRAESGALAWRQQWRKGDIGVFGLGGPQGIVLAPNGKELYVTGFADSSLTVFERATHDGSQQQAGDLRLRQVFFDGEGQVDQLQGPVAVAASPDDQHVYVAANTDNALVVFRRASADVIFGGPGGSFESP